MTSVIDSPFPISFPRAYESLNYSADFRVHPEDFYVEEILGFSFSGEGEHACFFIEKKSQNTHWVAFQVAEHYQIKENDVGFCGRKDRHAVTRQWISIYDPHRKVGGENFPDIEGVTLLESTRHNKKLRPGDHAENKFVIVLRQVRDKNCSILLQDQKAQFLKHAEIVLTQGVPNYFGVQRFGKQGNNLNMAQAWFEGGVTPPRRQKSMVLSAARSWIFNQVLAERIRQNCWRDQLQGDIIENDFPTGPLWGRGSLASTGDARILESTVQEKFSKWCERLEYQGLKQERRVLLLGPHNICCKWGGDDFIVSFTLPSGAFATAVLDELVHLNAT